MAIRGLGGIRGLGRPRNDFMSIEREPEFRVPSFDYVAPTLNEDAINKALEAVTVRKNANDARTNATDQYEADVADFKDIEASEIEQGIASLPEILNLAQEPFVDEGIGSFTPPSDPVISRMPNELSIPFVPPQIDIDKIINRDEQIFVPPPSIQDLDERDFRDTIGDDFLPTPPPSPIAPPPMIGQPVGGEPVISTDDGGRKIPDLIPATDPVIDLPSDDFLTGGKPSINLPRFKGGGREDFVRDFDDTGFGNYIIEDPIIPPMTPPTDPVIPIDNPYTNIFDIPGNNLGGNIPGYLDIDDRDFWDSIGEPPFDDIIFPPYDPPITDPDPDPIVPPPPVDEGPTGPINYYTGKPINNPYTPYSTDSGAAPLQKAISPRTFGQAPGFEPPPRKQPVPIIKPPHRPPPRRDDQIFVPPPDDFPKDLRPIAMAPAGAKGGGYLNKGISMLPMNGQGDTLTTQVFQSGFRPRR